MITSEQIIYSEIGGLIRQFCEDYGYDDWGASVLQFAQPIFQELPSPTILMNYFEGEKYGWVSTKYKPNEENYKNGTSEISYYRKIHIDIHFLKDPKTLLNASENEQSLLGYVSPIDVAQSLRAWFLSDFGVKALSNLGYGILDTSLIRDAVASTDEDVYTRFVNFTITLVVREKLIGKYSDFIKAENKDELISKFSTTIHALTTTNKDI